MRLIGSKEDEILTFFPDMVSIGNPQKTCPKRSILAPIKKPKLFSENHLKMEQSKLLIIPESQSKRFWNHLARTTS
jgi:hypothetical protein